MSSRRRVAGAVAAICFLVASLWAWHAASEARSPAQRAALAQPSTPSLVTAPVAAGPLVDSITVAGVLTRSTVITVTGPTEGAGVSRQVVTSLPVKAGDKVRAGQVIAQVSGRPVIVLPGRFPAYRDLGPGDEGPDVRQLQQALRARYGTRVTGKLDAQTVTDLNRLYRAIGYPAPTIEEEKGDPTPNPSGSPSGPPAAKQSRLRLPMGEFFFVPELPAVVAATPARIGDEGNGPLVTLTSGTWQVKVRLGPGTEQLLSSLPEDATFRLDGDEKPAVRLVGIRTADGDSKSQDGEGRQGDQPGAGEQTGPSQGGERHAVFALGGVPSDAVVGRTREIVIERGRSTPDTVVVPASALWTANDGSVSVEVVEKDGQTAMVPVKAVLSVGGRVAVRPLRGELPVGGLVVVAQRDAEPPR